MVELLERLYTIDRISDGGMIFDGFGRNLGVFEVKSFYDALRSMSGPLYMSMGSKVPFEVFFFVCEWKLMERF